MGASVSANAQDGPPPSVVSRYHEFITEGATDADRMLVSTMSIDEHGVMRSPHNPQIDILTADYSIPFIRNISSEIANIVRELKTRHAEEHRMWSFGFYAYRQTEQVDLAEVTDWFPLFLASMQAKKVHLVITTNLDTTKLHRVMKFLFHLSRGWLQQITVTFESSLTDRVEHSIFTAKWATSQLKNSAFESITHVTYFPFDPQAWIVHAEEHGGMISWTFRYNLSPSANQPESLSLDAINI
jgi:hypothetical protein